MAVSAHLFPKFQENALRQHVNIASDSLRAMLLSAYTYADTHSTMADVLGAGTEAVGTAYVAGGQLLTGVTLSSAAKVTTITCTSPSWANSTITAAFAVFYDSQGGTNATNYPICYWDFGGNQSSSNGAFTLTINASGLVTFTAS